MNFYKDLKWAKINPGNREYYSTANLKDKIKNKKFRIVLLGDSRIFKWKEPPEFNNCEVINRGISGDTTAGVMLRLESDVIELHPDVVIIQAGINDLTAIGVWPEHYEFIKNSCITNLDYIIETLRSNRIRVIFLTVFPNSEVSLIRRVVWSENIEKAVKAVNEYITMINKRDVFIIDCNDIFLKKTGLNKDSYIDTLHLSRQAYFDLNKKVEPVINNILYRKMDQQ